MALGRVSGGNPCGARAPANGAAGTAKDGNTLDLLALFEQYKIPVHTLAEAKQEGYLQYVTVNVDGQYHTTIIFDADGYGGAAGQELVTLQNVHYSQLYESHFAL